MLSSKTTLVNDRHLALRKLESDLNETNNIFKDLAAMVSNQDTAIDSIEANIEVGVARIVDEAEHDLEIAIRSKVFI